MEAIGSLHGGKVLFCGSRGGHWRAHISGEAVRGFAEQWPCYGPVRPLIVQWDASGNLVELEGDSEGDDARELARKAGLL